MTRKHKSQQHDGKRGGGPSKPGNKRINQATTVTPWLPTVPKVSLDATIVIHVIGAFLCLSSYYFQSRKNEIFKIVAELFGPSSLKELAVDDSLLWFIMHGLMAFLGACRYNYQIIRTELAFSCLMVVCNLITIFIIGYHGSSMPDVFFDGSRYVVSLCLSILGLWMATKREFLSPVSRPPSRHSEENGVHLDPNSSRETTPEKNAPGGDQKPGKSRLTPDQDKIRVLETTNQQLESALAEERSALAEERSALAEERSALAEERARSDKLQKSVADVKKEVEIQTEVVDTLKAAIAKGPKAKISDVNRKLILSREDLRLTALSLCTQRFLKLIEDDIPLYYPARRTIKGVLEYIVNAEYPAHMPKVEYKRSLRGLLPTCPDPPLDCPCLTCKVCGVTGGSPERAANQLARIYNRVCKQHRLPVRCEELTGNMTYPLESAVLDTNDYDVLNKIFEHFFISLKVFWETHLLDEYREYQYY